MQLKIVLRGILAVVILVGSVLTPAFLFYFIQQNPNLFSGEQVRGSSAQIIKNVTVSPEQEQIIFGLPVRLKIPAINVDALVEYVGLTSEGAMDVPKNKDNVAWFEFGQRPGENGSAAIAGHYGWNNGKASAFDDLYKLRKGDKLYIEDDKGTIITFVMRKNRRYAPDADTSDIFSSSDGKSHLNLITCDGEWNKTSQDYSQRLVVFADKE